MKSARAATTPGQTVQPSAPAVPTKAGALIPVQSFYAGALLALKPK